MGNDPEKDNRFAVLIDADNVSQKYIKALLDEISNDGTATYKRIYGDWTTPNLASWKNVLLENSIQPIQQYGYTTGKNATDSAMIIDAMDILYTGNVDGFCIVSSDSDFTRLAARLREGGMVVVGMGEKKTPQAFIAACNKFKYLEILARPAAPSAGEVPAPKEAAPPIGEMTSLETVKKAILTIIDELSDEGEWAFAGEVGSILLKRYPDFDVRNYGYKKFTPFLRSLNVVEVRSEKSADGNQRTVLVRAAAPAEASKAPPLVIPPKKQQKPAGASRGNNKKSKQKGNTEV